MGELRPLNGNLRSFWYRYLEHFARKYGLLERLSRRVGESAEDRMIDTMTEQIGQFVAHRIFRYTGEMKFVSPLGALWKIGRKRRGWFYFTEKEGLWEVCQGIWADDKLSPTVMASDGEPSGLVLEKLAMELWKMGVRSLKTGTFCDPDPWGWCIDATIDAAMRRYGFEVDTWRLVTPKLFTEDDLSGARDYSAIIAKFEDPNYKATSKERLIYNWFRLSNGHHGKPLALHSDVITEEKRDSVNRAFLKALEAGKEPAGIKVNPKKNERLLAPMSLQRKFR